MLRHHLKMTLRTLRKQFSFSLINILGLSVSLACFIVIALYVDYELSYDKFYKDHDRIFRINARWVSEGGESRYATSPARLAGVMQAEIPEVEAITRVFTWSDFTMRPDNDMNKVFRETNVWLADETFFKVLDYGLLAGDPETALKEPVSVVLPKSTAIRYFGQQAFDENNIVGRNLLGGKDAGTPWKITGIMEDQPENSHFQYDFLISTNTMKELADDENWTWNFVHTYVKFNTTPDEQLLKDTHNKLDEIVVLHAIPWMGYTEEQYKESNTKMEYLLQPITDIHLRSNYNREMQPNGDINYIYTFVTVAILILVLACVNFMNLATAQSANRAKEVGVRKVLGSGKAILIKRFLSESVVYSLVSLIVALGIVEFFLILVGDWLGHDFQGAVFQNARLAFMVLGVAIVIGFLAGLYPAFYLTAFRPSEVLKGKLRSGVRSSGLRNVLVVFQFTISVALIISTVVINQQVDYIQSSNLGFDKENVLIIQNDREIEDRRQDFKDALNQLPGVINASFSSGTPGEKGFMMRGFSLENSNEDQGIRWYQIDDQYLNTMNIQMAEGRAFSREIASDTAGILLNEAAVRRMGLTDPIGKYIIRNLGAPDEAKLQIIGVIKDFNFESFKNKIKPLALEYMHGFVFKDYVSVRLAPGNHAQQVAEIRDLWHKFEPGVPMSYSFLDENFDALFASEMKLRSVFGVLTGLAIFIACLGLFGLAAYTAEQRKKEIGIRKVLGASVAIIIATLGRNFALMTGLGFVIATPLAWYAMREWLSSFEYKIDVELWVFPVAGLVTFAITLVTILYQSTKAALVNPVESLKEE
ncbi:MAG: ABC transporter permease [Bacteroidota bacterium]